MFWRGEISKKFAQIDQKVVFNWFRAEEGETDAEKREKLCSLKGSVCSDEDVFETLSEPPAEFRKRAEIVFSSSQQQRFFFSLKNDGGTTFFLAFTILNIFTEKYLLALGKWEKFYFPYDHSQSFWENFPGFFWENR